MVTDTAYSSLSNSDLLKKLIGVRQAKKLYRGSLTPLFAAVDKQGSPPEKCLVAKELVKRFIGEKLQGGCVLTQPEDARDFLHIHFAGQEYESFVTLYLDGLNRLITVEELFRGSVSETTVYPREIVRSALRLNAEAVIFAHNHPNGEAKPSTADRVLTKLLKKTLALVDVAMRDHLIIAPTGTYSFAERGYL